MEDKPSKFKVDYVVTYLDPTDPYWLQQFSQYQNVEMKRQAERYDTDGKKLLKYHFRGVAKNMPWVNNLFLVVFSESQVPDWINRNTVKVVTDDMYIPNEFLPTFNSSTKYMFMHRIPGLEEHYLYSDDDYYCLNETSQLDWFREDGTPNTVYNNKSIVKNPEVLGISKNKSWPYIWYNSATFSNIVNGIEHDDNEAIAYPYWHVPGSLLKSDVEGWYNDNINMIHSSITKTRSWNNFSGCMWILSESFKYGNRLNIKYDEVQWNTTKKKNICDSHDRGIQIFNINCTANCKDIDYVSQFEILFPEKCKYEV